MTSEPMGTEEAVGGGPGRALGAKVIVLPKSPERSTPDGASKGDAVGCTV